MLTIEQVSKLVGAGGLFYTFAFAPALLTVLVRRRPREERRWFFNIAVTVFAAWCVINAYRLYIEVPTNAAYAHSQGDLMYDGVGGNAVTLLVTGWLIPLVECFVVWAIFSASARRRMG